MTTLAAQRRSLVEQHGRHCLAYSTLQPGLDYFDTERGFIAYRRVRVLWREHWTVLGDPVCSAADLRGLIARFLEDLERRSARVRCSFWQIGEATARVLIEHGFTVNSLGYEVSVDLHAPGGAGGKPWSFLERAVRDAVSDGSCLKEATWDDALPGALQEVSERWFARKLHKHELSFLTRPVSSSPEPDVRVFVAEKEGRIEAFAVFDPVYEGGQVTGYYAQTLRAGSGAAERWRSALVHHAAERFAAEAGGALVLRLELGICPCAVAGPELDAAHSSRVSRWTCVLLHRAGKLYNFRGLEEHKNRYLGGLGAPAQPRGTRTPKYLAARSRAPATELLALLRSMGIIPQLSTTMSPETISRRISLLGLVLLLLSVSRCVTDSRFPGFLLYKELEIENDTGRAEILTATSAGLFAFLLFLFNFLKHLNAVRNRILKAKAGDVHPTVLAKDWIQLLCILPLVTFVLLDLLLCARIAVGQSHKSLPLLLWCFTAALLFLYTIAVRSEVRTLLEKLPKE